MASRYGTDGAAADVMGTILMLGATISLITIVAVQMTGELGAAEEVPDLDVALLARDGETSVELVHMGGAGVDLGNVRVVVFVNGSSAYDGLAGTSGTPWRAGDVAIVGPLDSTLSHGARVEVSVVLVAQGATVATAQTQVHVPFAAAPLSGFTLALQSTGGSTDVRATTPGGLYLEALPSHPEGRKAIRQVAVNLSPLNGPNHFELVDTGTDGDAINGDGVHSAHVFIPAEVPLKNYTLHAIAVDAHGHVAQASMTVRLEAQAVPQFYMGGLFHRVGHKVNWAGTGSGNSGDKMDGALVFETNSTITFEGKTYTVSGASFVYDHLRTGSPTAEGLSGKSCTSGTTTVHIWSKSGQKIDGWKQGRDTLRYYWRVTFSAGGSDVITTHIWASESTDWFIWRPHEQEKVVQTNGWPTDFKNC